MICKELDMIRENGITEVTYENLERFSEEINNHINNCKQCRPERLNPKTCSMDECLFPPPWNVYEHPEKTEGWIAFQREMKKDPEYYKMR
jgi:hypothetical protein